MSPSEALRSEVPFRHGNFFHATCVGKKTEPDLKNGTYATGRRGHVVHLGRTRNLGSVDQPFFPRRTPGPIRSPEDFEIRSARWQSRCKLCVVPPVRSKGLVLKGVSSLSGYRHHVNDPSAGSPTDTLLRLLRPLPQIICPTSQPNDHGQADHGTHPYRSLTGTIGRSDGRCVQRAGT